jgi:hypothetical protein
MRKLFIVLFTLLIALPSANGSFGARRTVNVLQDQDNQERRVMTLPHTNRRRRIRREGHRRRGIRSAFADAGRGAGRGGKRFGKNIAKGRPIRAGKELGKGMGSFGKNVGKGVGRTAKRVFTP